MQITLAEFMGDVLLDDISPEPLASNALNDVLARLDNPIELDPTSERRCIHFGYSPASP